MGRRLIYCAVFLQCMNFLKIPASAFLNLTTSGDQLNGTEVGCNSNITLICKAGVKRDDMIWRLNGNQIAECTFGICSSVSTVSKRFGFVFDTLDGEFNISLQPVTNDENKAVFECSDFVEIKSLTLNVTGDYSIYNSINEKFEPNITELTISTGCIANTTNIHFEWNLVNAVNSSVIKPLPEDIVPIASMTSNDCLSNNSCGGNGKVKKSSSLTIKEEDHINADKFYLAVTVKYADLPKHDREFRFSSRPFNIKVSDTSAEEICLPCWVYGVILAVTILIVVVCAILMKVCYPSNKVGCLWYWEIFTLVDCFTVIIYLVVIIIFAGVYKKCKEKSESFECWEIYLVVLGIIVICVTFCLFLYVFIEPVQSANVISRRVEGKGMSIKMHIESRLSKLKTYYIQLERNGQMLDPVELNRILVPGSRCEYALNGLILDSDYQAHLFSSVCKLPSMKKQITFDTKGRPMPPTNIYQDKQLRTEDSITLRWTAAKGPKHHFNIKYKRSKRPKSDWVNLNKINSSWCTIDGLRPGTSYTIVVYAENTVGPSEESEPVLVKTRAVKPVPPQDFKCTRFTQNEVQLSWRPSRKLNNQQFLLTVFNNSEEITPGLVKYEQETCIAYKRENTMTHTVSNLSPGCNYEFEIYTLAWGVLSKRSTIITVDTKRNPKRTVD